MRAFTHLYSQVQHAVGAAQKQRALEEYLKTEQEETVHVAVALLLGKLPKRIVTLNVLREWVLQETGIPVWLFEESAASIGDLASTIAMLLNQESGQDALPLNQIVHQIASLSTAQLEDKQAFVTEAWKTMDAEQRLVFNKLLTGTFRVKVSAMQAARALCGHSGIEARLLAQRLSGDWNPDTSYLFDLLHVPHPPSDTIGPLAFTPSRLLEDPFALGNPNHFQAEWSWDGMRVQVLMANDHIQLWSKQEELLQDHFPELQGLNQVLTNGTLLEAELILHDQHGNVLPGTAIQKRLALKVIGPHVYERVSATLVLRDVMRVDGNDCTAQPLQKRRKLLEQLHGKLHPYGVKISPVLTFTTWEALKEQQSGMRQQEAEAILLRDKRTVYTATTGYQWKASPMHIDAVLLYVSKFPGSDKTMITECTFAVWKADELVPLTKASSGLSPEELKELDSFVKNNTTEKFGPVRSVKAERVFTLYFDEVHRSSRHKSGLSLKNPRIAAYRPELTLQDVSKLEDLTVRGFE